jgi:hypothetical protein
VPASLRPLTEEEISEFIEWQVEQYVDERVRSGERPEIARRIASEQSRALFPEGVPADGQLLFRVLDDEGTVVGMLWIGPQRPRDQPGAFWVFYVALKSPIGVRDTADWPWNSRSPKLALGERQNLD